MNDSSDFSLFPKFQRPNQFNWEDIASWSRGNLLNFDMRQLFDV